MMPSGASPFKSIISAVSGLEGSKEVTDSVNVYPVVMEESDHQEADNEND